MNEKIEARLEEARILRSRGDQQVRQGQLSEARVSYAAALEICRETGSRLGEAICIQCLGNLDTQERRFAEARGGFREALAIYSELGSRLGAANSLQSLGQINLHEGRLRKAFAAFQEVIATFGELQERHGVEACLGYLARTAWRAGRGDQALLLAEEALRIGRQIEDRYGQTITLELQADIWRQADDLAPALGAVYCHRALAAAMGDARLLVRYDAALAEELPHLDPAFREALEANPDSFRLQGIREAHTRFAASGLELFAPPPE